MNRRPEEHELHAWLDGEASEESAQRVELWLAANPEAAKEVESWRRDGQRLRQAMYGSLTQPHKFVPSIPHQVKRRLRRQLQWRLAMAFTLVLALGVGGFSGWHMRNAGLEDQMLPMNDALTAYKLFSGVTPARLDITDQKGLDGWVSRYFINGAAPPNLEQYGFHLQGARLMATEQGPAAVVIYQGPQGIQVAWYIRPIQPVKLPHGQRVADDLMAQYWSDDHYNYALVTPALDPQLTPVRDAMSVANS